MLKRFIVYIKTAKEPISLSNPRTDMMWGPGHIVEHTSLFEAFQEVQTELTAAHLSDTIVGICVQEMFKLPK